MSNVKKIANIILVVLFSLLLFVFCLLNLSHLVSAFREEMGQEGTVQEKLLRVEQSFQEDTYQREKLIDLYGISLNVLNQKIVGNFDFIKDDLNIIQRFAFEVNTDDFLNSMEQLSEISKETDTPLLYVTLPDKTTYLPLATSDQFVFEGQLSKEVGNALKGTVDCLDIEAMMQSDVSAPTFEEFFFKTDVHCSTYGEFWMAKTIAEHLSANYGLVFPNQDTVFDLSNYTISNYEFVGNTARSAGEFFVGTDQFEIYTPNFDVDLTLNNPSRSEWKTGSFQDVMLNGDEKKETKDKYVYWVTNYGRYTSPYYQYTNSELSDDAPKILMISDSVFMRGVSYLALGCRELTVLDPRFFGTAEYLASELMATKYDAIVVIGCSSGFYDTSFASQIELPDIPTSSMISPEAYGKWIGDQGIWVDTCNGQEARTYTAIQVEKNQSFTLQGWAADFSADAPFSALYLKVGDILLKCDYGDELTGMIEHYEKESLLKTGFEVTVPWSYLQEGAVTEISFFGVSADGQALYQPVICQLAY